MIETRRFHTIVAGLLFAIQSSVPYFVSAQQVHSLGNLVWIDQNENGLRDADEPGLAGVVVHLLNCSGGVVTSTISQEDGHYLFPVVLPGNYRQQFVLPPGYEFTAQQAGSDTDIDSDADADGLTQCFVFAATGNDLRLDAGVIQRGSIQGHAWYDRNRNGIHESREVWLEGVLVTLLNCAGEEIANTLTTSGGIYAFTSVPLGVYRIGCPSMSGLALTRANSTSDALDSDLLPEIGMSECLALAASQPLLTVDMGIRIGFGCVTFTQNDWGAPPAESHLSTLLVDHFPKLYRRGLTLGLSTNQLKFTSAQAIIEFLPASGPLGTLVSDHTDPLVTEAGEFAGHLLALKLNVNFSLRRRTAPGLARLRIEPGHKLAGMRVARVLVLAQRVLGGRTDLLPPGCTLADLNDAIARINRNFDCGMMDLGFVGR